MTRALFAALLLTACNGSGTTDFQVADFAAGNFQLTTTAVSDGCMDGAFAVLFMPDGSAREWPTVTEIPAYADLPSTYTVTLPSPYSNMEITVEAEGASGFRFADATQTAVLIDDVQWPGCVVDMGITASFVISDADSFAGSADLSMANFAGDNCPVLTGGAAECVVSLDLNGARQ